MYRLAEQMISHDEPDLKRDRATVEIARLLRSAYALSQSAHLMTLSHFIQMASLECAMIEAGSAGQANKQN